MRVRRQRVCVCVQGKEGEIWIGAVHADASVTPHYQETTRCWPTPSSISPGCLYRAKLSLVHHRRASLLRAGEKLVPLLPLTYLRPWPYLNLITSPKTCQEGHVGNHLKSCLKGNHRNSFAEMFCVTKNTHLIKVS